MDGLYGVTLNTHGSQIRGKIHLYSTIKGLMVNQSIYTPDTKYLVYTLYFLLYVINVTEDFIGNPKTVTIRVSFTT